MKKQHDSKTKIQRGSEKGPKRRQISVTLSEEVHARFWGACEIQEHTEGQLARILIEWALPFYERTRSVESLKYLATKHFTSLADKPLEQREVDLSLESESMVAAGGR